MQEQQSTHPYKTLGGFLLVILTLTLLFAARALYVGVIELEKGLPLIEIYTRFGSPMWPVYYGMLVASSFIQIVFVILVAKKNRRILSVLVMSAFVMLLGIVLVLTTFSFNPTYTIPPLVEASTAVTIPDFTLAAAFLFEVLVINYFCRSVRVRTYMGSADYITKSFFKFVKPPLPAVPDSETDVWMNEGNVFGIPDDRPGITTSGHEVGASVASEQLGQAAANQQPDQSRRMRGLFGLFGLRYKYPEHYYIKTETTDKPYFSKVMQNNFKQYVIREDVSAEEFGGEGRPFDFVFYKHGECVAAIMVVERNGIQTKPYLKSKDLAEAAGVPLVTFHMQMPNVEGYVVDHTREKAKLVD